MSAPPPSRPTLDALELARPGPEPADRLRLVERSDPVPEPDELVLSVAACAVCRTDLQLVEGDLSARRLPIVPGHQAVGRILAVGSDVSGWATGDRAGVGWLASACGKCPACLRGRENLCPDARFTGWDRDGGYATHLTVRADFAFRIPDAFDDLSAAPLLCGGVISYRSLRVSGIEPGGRLGLFGFGASALLPPARGRNAPGDRRPRHAKPGKSVQMTPAPEAERPCPEEVMAQYRHGR